MIYAAFWNLSAKGQLITKTYNFDPSWNFDEIKDIEKQLLK